MEQLSSKQLVELSCLWDELQRLFPGNHPPETDDQLIADDLDTLFAGVMSSKGRLWPNVLADLEEASGQNAESPALGNLLDRVATLLRTNGLMLPRPLGRT